MTLEEYLVKSYCNRYNYTTEEDFVNISGTTVNSKATINGTGEVKLLDEKTKLEIKVTAENGKERIYFITVIKNISTEEEIIEKQKKIVFL